MARPIQRWMTSRSPRRDPLAFKARRVLAALLRIGWSIKRDRGGSHRVLRREGWPDFVFAFHDDEEIVPACWGDSFGTPA